MVPIKRAEVLRTARAAHGNCPFGRATSRTQHLESPSEVQEETHVSRTAGRMKLVFGDTGL